MNRHSGRSTGDGAMDWRVIVLILAFAAASPAHAAEPSIDQELHALQPIIGGYPPAIASTRQRDAVIKRYRALKVRLDAAVAAAPDDVAAHLQRATLEDMGHNIDFDGAFDAARGDYTFVIEHHPSDITALLGLGSLLVNTNPTYAGKAKALFLSAQCAYGKEPLEAAQRGLFFADYYLGHMTDAKARSRYLVKHWPNNQTYGQLDKTVDAVLARTHNTAVIADDPDLETCKGNP